MLNEYREYLKIKKSEFKQKIRQNCTEEENAKFAKLEAEGKELPEGIEKHFDPQKESQYLRKIEIQMSEEEINEYLNFKQHDALQSIRKCVVFFTVIAIINIIATFITLIL